MELLIVLIVVSLLSGAVAGIGGSSGFVPIVALVYLTSLSTQQISGTIAASFFIATSFGAALYWYSNNHRKKLLVILIPPGLIGTQIGSYINSFIPEIVFNILIGVIALFLGVLLLKDGFDLELKLENQLGVFFLILLGLIVGVLAGITGIGGIPIIVPALVLLNVRPLTSIATGFAVAAANTLSTSVIYYIGGYIQYEYVAVVGIPFTIAQIIGWKASPRIDIGNLKTYLGGFNILMGLYLIISNLL